LVQASLKAKRIHQMIRNAQERERRIRTGLAFQERVRRKIIEVFLKCFPQLRKEGIRSCEACNNGSDIVLSSDWRRHLPVGIECKFSMKNYKTIKKDWLQAVRQIERMETNERIFPILSVTGGHQLTFMIMEISDWLIILSEYAEMKQQLEEHRLERIRNIESI
jgi:hypothetical protein